MTPELPLGKPTRYPETYDEGLLYPVERAPQRRALGLPTLPFTGLDRWTAWELAWLDDEGRPQAAIAQFDVPCTSPRIVESKSVKLWLASLYNERFASVAVVRELLGAALERATGAAVALRIDTPAAWSQYARHATDAVSIDHVLLDARPDAPAPGLLNAHGATVHESLVSRTFRSVCPVTGQPDYATVALTYRGSRIDHAALATYLFGYRRHPGFHEDCAERIFIDVWRHCAPAALAVDASFTRRGGIDIRPFRSSDPAFCVPGGRDPRL